MNTLKHTVACKSLSQWLAPSRRSTDKIAWQLGQWVTVEQMRSDVAHLYANLIACEGVKKSDALPTRWALNFDNGYAFTVALLAVLHSGGVPILFGSTQEKLLQERCHLYDALVTDLSLNLNHPKVYFKDESSTKREPSTETAVNQSYIKLPVISEDAPVVLYTSGSTGEPKEVIKPLCCLDAEARWTAQLWGNLLKEAVVLSTVSHQHQYGLTFKIMLPMSLGIPFVAFASEYQEQMLGMQTQLLGDALSEGTSSQKKEVFFPTQLALISSPAFLKRLDTNLPQLTQCCFVLSAGGKLYPEEAKQARQWLGIPVHEIYGSTETGVLAWRAFTEQESVWRKFKGVELVFNENSSRWVAHSELIPGPQGVTLDDRLELCGDDPSCFTLHGRYDRIVKLEEKRISLTEVEKRLAALEGLQEAVVFPVQRGRRQIIAAVVVPSDKQGRISEGRQEELKAALSSGKPSRQLTQLWRQELMQTLEPIAVPRLWQMVDAIPLNAQGKRDYETLRQYFK